MSSKLLLWTAVCLPLCGAPLCVAQTQQPGADQIRLMTLFGTPLPVLAGKVHGTFAKYHVDVQAENLPNSAAMRASLAAGKAEVAYAAVDNAVAMVELSGADVQIVSGGEGSQNDLIVQPSINTVKDLKGKVVLVDAVNTAYALQLKKILLDQGLETPRDYELNPLGATPARLTAMIANKNFAGSMLGPPASIEALESGLKSLGNVPDLVGPYQAGGNFVMKQWAEKHRSTLVRYLEGFIESERWVMDPANKQAVIDLMIEKQHLKPEIAAQTYALEVTRPGGFEKDARIDLVGFSNVLKLRAEVEGQWGGKPPAPEKYLNSSYYDEALEQLTAATTAR